MKQNETRRDENGSKEETGCEEIVGRHANNSAARDKNGNVARVLR